MQSHLSNYSAVIHSPIGLLGFNIEHDKLVKLDFLYSKEIALVKPTSSLAKETVKQLTCYFKEPTFQFDLPLNLTGTEFQMRVWQGLQTIPACKTASYGELARLLNTSARAIGNACRRNPTPIIVPCHRIIASQSIGGFSGATSGAQLEIKTWLLKHERFAG